MKSIILKIIILAIVLGLMPTVTKTQTNLEKCHCTNGKYGYVDVKTNKVVILCEYDAVAEKFINNFAWVNIGGKYQHNDSTKVIGGKYGFIDKAGNLVIPCEYKIIDETIFPLKLNNKWGYIDKTGKVVIPLIYDVAYDFYKGLAGVKLDNKWGYIDTTGEEAISFIYDSVWYFDYHFTGLAQVKKR